MSPTEKIQRKGKNVHIIISRYSALTGKTMVFSLQSIVFRCLFLCFVIRIVSLPIGQGAHMVDVLEAFGEITW